MSTQRQAMNNRQGTGRSTDVDVDALVARYAPVGRRLRRQRRLKQAAAALLLPVLGIAGFQAWEAGAARLRTAVSMAAGGSPGASQASDAARIEAALRDISQLKTSVESSVAAEIRALAEQRDRMQRLSTQLAQQLAAVNGERTALAEQSRRFETQQKLLADALSRVEQQRRQVEAQRSLAGDSSPEIERQLAEINRQRQALERQQQEFQGQSEQLAQELKRINAQRLEIERQREAIEAQREEVQGLLNQINQVGVNRLRQQRQGLPRQPGEESPAMVAAPAEADAPAPPAEAGPLATLAAVDAGVLSEMRGGVDMGNDFAVAIGITRSGSINGIEQYSSTMYLEDLTRGGATFRAAEPVLLQTGADNLVSVDALNGMSPNVTTIIQNTLDDQVISNRTIMDISLQNVTTVLQGLSNAAVVGESLSRQP